MANSSPKLSLFHVQKKQKLPLMREVKKRLSVKGMFLLYLEFCSTA